MKYLMRKALFYLVAFWVAITLNFLMPRMMPGNPVQIMVAKFRGRINPQAIHAFTRAFGLNTHASLLAQYGQYLSQLSHGNLGISLAMYSEPVSKVLAAAFPWTLLVVGLATVMSFILGSFIGVLASWKRGGILDMVAPTVSTFTAAFPYFWLALIVLYIFAFKLPWFPLAHAYANGNATWSPSNWPDILYHATLPALTIVVSSIGGWLLSMRNNMITTMGQDYISIARAKGLPARRIMFQYAARNAILPNMTGFAMSLGFVLSGALLTEVVFSYPGLGYTLYQAVQADDYPLMQGTLLLIAVGVLLANFLVDILYVKMDPRVQNQ